MSHGRSSRGIEGYLLLLFILLCLYFLRGSHGSSHYEKTADQKSVFVQITGDVAAPGVYSFHESPQLKDALLRAGGLKQRTETEPYLPTTSLHSGAMIRIQVEGNRVSVFQSEMSAFHKVTLGIPLSLNKESPEGLTAIPGIGPKLAEDIVSERSRRGAFRDLDDLLTIHGIGTSLHSRIKPYLVL
jgi:competence protein ComEA